jgi:replication-associated recombination protein RarA
MKYSNKTSQCLPINNQRFAEIIEQHRLYIDNTDYIYKIVTSTYNSVILCRTMNFGKTSLLQTLKESFSGNRRFFSTSKKRFIFDRKTDHVAALGQFMSESNFTLIKI